MGFEANVIPEDILSLHSLAWLGRWGHSLSSSSLLTCGLCLGTSSLIALAARFLLIYCRTFSRGSLAIALVATILSRLIRYLQYGILHPQKVLYLAPFLLYLYLQQIVKIYALLTLENVGFGLERKIPSHLLILKYRMNGLDFDLRVDALLSMAEVFGQSRCSQVQSYHSQRARSTHVVL